MKDVFLINGEKRMRAGFLMGTVALLSCHALCGAADGALKPGKDAGAKVFGLGKVWSMHLTIQPDQWEKMQPKRVPGGFGFPPRQDGKAAQPKQDVKPAEANRDTKPRNTFGFEFTYVKGDLEIEGRTFKDVGVRYKGNGSYAVSQGRLKRPLKIDLDRYRGEQSFFGQTKLTLNSNVMDPSAAREVLSYLAFRSLDVPASRTAYAKLTLTVPGKFDKEFVGLYTLVETIDKTFLKNHFGSSKGLLVKPEFVAPLEHLGEAWEPYEKRYRPKTPADAKARQRLIELTKLVHKADDKTFQEEIGKYLDVDEFLRFLAVTVGLVNMDSFIFSGPSHNYLLYLDPKTNKFVFLPWDLDLSMGAFGMMGPPDEMMDLSIRQPTSNRNRLIERLFAEEKVYAAYKGHLRKLLEKGFTEEGVRKDLAVIQAAIAPIQKQEKEAATVRHEDNNRGGFGGGFNRMPDLPAFAAKRVASIQGQLDGKRKGTVLSARFGFGPGQFLARPILEAVDKNKDGKLSKKEMNAAVKALFAKLDKDHKGELNQEALAEGINKLLPQPPGFGGPPGPGGPPAVARGGPPAGGPGGPPPGASGQRPKAEAGTPGAPGERPKAGGDAPRAPGAPAGRPGFGPPGGGLGGMYARSLVEKAGKNGQVNEERLLALAAKLFTEADKNKDGKLEDKELIEALNKLMPPFGPPGGPPGAPPAAKKEPKQEGK